MNEITDMNVLRLEWLDSYLHSKISNEVTNCHRETFPSSFFFLALITVKTPRAKMTNMNLNR